MTLNRSFSAASIIIILVILLNACQSQATPSAQAKPSPLSAAMSELQGKVELKQSGQDSFTPAKADSFLDENGQVQTGDDGRVRLDLSTGTIIRVSPTSLFTLISNEPTNGNLKTSLELTLGRIFIVLNGGSMEVQTPSGTASVRGSYMMVEINHETLDVVITCLEGNCSAENPAGSVNFTAGFKSILFHKDPVTGKYIVPGIEPMSQEDFQKWLDQNIPGATELYTQAIASLTAEASPSPVPATEAPTQLAGGNGTCFALLEPSSNTSLPQLGPVNFKWGSQEGATSYVLTFKYPDGTIVSFETTETNMKRYLESMPGAGDYQWDVAAYGSDGSQICKTQPLIFSKPITKPEKTKNPNKEKEPTCDPQTDPYECLGPGF